MQNDLTYMKTVLEAEIQERLEAANPGRAAGAVRFLAGRARYLAAHLRFEECAARQSLLVRLFTRTIRRPAMPRP